MELVLLACPRVEVQWALGTALWISEPLSHLVAQRFNLVGRFSALSYTDRLGLHLWQVVSALSLVFMRTVVTAMAVASWMAVKVHLKPCADSAL